MGRSGAHGAGSRADGIDRAPAMPERLPFAVGRLAFLPPFSSPFLPPFLPRLTAKSID
ncbi:hypothetical protein [Verminephrobacter eiseniae]|uniref:hypothetical protein n=1 Tax=Verminephrobacter eiseniae TaxID=364317 RepID=UPI002237D415|nr:hypothetical protein [Verminephrobacter eiseniae]